MRCLVGLTFVNCADKRFPSHSFACIFPPHHTPLSVHFAVRDPGCHTCKALMLGEANIVGEKQESMGAYCKSER
jgi:hypothetical protein